MYASNQIHHSFQKAASLAGFPLANVREIDVDDQFRVDVAAMEDAIALNGPAVFRTRLRDRRVERVASLASPRRLASSWIGLTPDDSLLISDQTGGSEIYALDLEWP